MRKKHPILFIFLSLFAVSLFIFIAAYTVTVGLGKFSIAGGEKIAVVKIEGVLLESKDIIEELREHRENKSVKAILLRIDSPGGAVAPSQEIYTEVLKIREEGKKKIVTSMGSVAASGGYYIASASDKIVANPGSVTGSIGVIIELANVSGLMKKVGVESVVIKSGKFKDVGSLFRTMTTEERELLQGVIDDTYDQFIEAVSVGRGISKEDLIPIADGRVFTGRQAKKLGLVDELGSMQDAIRITAEMAGIKGEPDIIEKKKKVSILERLLKNSSLISWIDTGKKIAGGEGTFSMKYMLAF
ncbi:MAG: signal peptide peptidase SppA [Nitrospirota bacterium]